MIDKLSAELQSFPFIRSLRSNPNGLDIRVDSPEKAPTIAGLFLWLPETGHFGHWRVGIVPDGRLFAGSLGDAPDVVDQVGWVQLVHTLEMGAHVYDDRILGVGFCHVPARLAVLIKGQRKHCIAPRVFHHLVFLLGSYSWRSANDFNTPVQS